MNIWQSFVGILACLDGYMNIAMEQTEEYVNGQLKNKYGDAFIRGNNGNYVLEYCCFLESIHIFHKLIDSYFESLCSALYQHNKEDIRWRGLVSQMFWGHESIIIMFFISKFLSIELLCNTDLKGLDLDILLNTCILVLFVAFKLLM